MRIARPLAVGVLLALVLGGVVVVRRLDTGPVLRTVPVGALPWRVAVDEQTGRVFIANFNDQTMSVLDTATGQLVRTVPVPDSPYIVALDSRHARVFVTHNSSNTMSLLDAASGRILRTVPVGSSPQWPAVDEQSGHVFVANAGDGTVTMLDAQTGQLIRTVSVNGNAPDSIAIDVQTAHVFVTLGDGTVAMLDAQSGRLLRTVQVGQATGYFLAVAPQEHRVFVAYPAAKSVGMLDTRTGSLLRTIRLGFSPTAEIVNEQTARLFVAGALTLVPDTEASGPGRVAVLDARTGAILRTVHVDDTAGGGIALDTRTDHILVAASGPVDRNGDLVGYGYLDVLDGQSGRLLRHVPVEGHPQGVAVDERVGRAFVVNTNVNIIPGPFLVHAPPQALGERWARGLKQQLPWLPITLLAPRPAGTGSVTVLDLARL